MSTHAKLSPSSRHRWQLCPGSVREERKYPDSKGGPAAIDGTHSHTLLEKCITARIGRADHFVGMTLEDHEGSFTVDAVRAERVQVALDYIYKQAHCAVAVAAETRVGLYDLTGRDDLDGQLDVQLFYNDGDIEIIDYKDGMTPVDAVDNAQLEQYALGAVDAACTQPDSLVYMTIIQPKLRVKGMEPISRTSMTALELRSRVLPKLIVEAAATDNPDAPLVPGDKQCRNCKAKGGCSALVNKNMEAVGMFFKPITTISEIDITENTKTDHPFQSVAQQSATKDPTTMSNDELRELLEAAPLMRQMLQAAEEEAENRAKAGQAIPGYKLVNGPGSRAWAHDEDEMVDKLVKMGVPKTAVYVTKLVSPAQAEKLTWEKKDGTKVTLSPKQLQRMETEYVTKKKGRLILVPESDNRPAATQDITGLFSPVTPSLPDWLK